MITLYGNTFCWRKYNARSRRAYFNFVITDAENRVLTQQVTSGYIGHKAVKKAAKNGLARRLRRFEPVRFADTENEHYDVRKNI
ncbi:hypothetical protein [Burkholderia sp. Ax-1724]|uniref:hypothetical protein n=1 Tax=Burkholderia sp. Ax-1724 TaxID=2608336 RepID=UPI00141EB03B|nr:hypothetical protein [Burkholderia sp. Ax-1724]NIF54422.1 hypothetical protein [Burkholderia sp. Ax-1724]